KSSFGERCKIYKQAELRESTLGDLVQVGDSSIVLQSSLESNIAINRRNFIQQSKIGRFTYTGFNTVVRSVEIGRFCSISWNVFLGGKNHDYTKVTNSSLWAFHNMNGTKDSTHFIYGDGQGDCKIGNDVWIAANAVVLRGVTIGNGAIVGAGAVVTKDIPPFSIAVGNPAKVIKYRFEEKIVRKLDEIAWWNWPIDVVQKNLDLIYSTSMDEKLLHDVE